MAVMHNRRALHLPLLPIPYSLPSPAEPPYSFFPSFPPPPHPPPAPQPLQPTVPANISFSHPAPHAREASFKVVAVILLPLLAVVLLATSTFAFLVHRRRRQRYFSDPHPSFRATYKSPSTAAAASNNGSVNARTAAAPVEDGPSEDTLDGCGKLYSPGLLPLRPLPLHFQHWDGEAEETGASDEEFFSTRGSLIEKESSGRASSSWRTISAAAVEECGSRSWSQTTPPYPSSNLDSSPRSSPVTSSPRVRSSSGHYSSKSERGFAGSLEFLAPTPVTPRPPPPPLTPSPPKRKPTTLFPPSSPIATECNRKVELCDRTRENLRTDDFPQQLLGISTLPAPPQQNQDPPPPPPPPPPPFGYWLSQSRKLQARQPPLPLSVPSKPYLASAVSIDPTANSKAAEKNAEISRPKLKPLHWDKVQASSHRAMAWDQLKSSSFHVDEEMIETLFVSNATTSPPKETNNPQALPLPTQENWVLHPKKAQNISILLRALNVTKEEVCEALLEGCTDSLGTELLETLLKMSPTKEEEHKLKERKNDSAFKFGPAENFLKALIDIPFVFKRLDAMLYIANFNSEIDFLMKSFETLKAACEELRSSRLFSKLLDAVLKTGNRMNVGTFRGDAHAFKLETLLKLVDIKGNDGKTTVLHFVVQEITRAEGSRLSATCNMAAEAPLLQEITPQHDLECRKLGLQIVAGLEGELSNVKKAAAFDSDILSGYLSNLVGGMEKINEVLKLNEELGSENSNRKFHDEMTWFLKSAEDDIIRVQAQEIVASSLVKEITEYFHGNNSAREETHPLRIFMVVRDFLLILVQVCKDVGSITEQATISLERKLPAPPTNPIFVPIFPRFHAPRYQSSDDESSLSSWCDT